MLYDLRKKPKYRPVYYVITVLAGTICPLMFFSTVFLLPKIAVIIGAVHFVLFLFIAFDKKSFVRGAETEMKKLYRIVCVIRNVLWFAVIILWFAFMLAYGSDNKIFYPIKRFVVVDRVASAGEFLPEKLPKQVTDYRFSYAPAWQDSAYVELSFRTDDAETEKISSSAEKNSECCEDISENERFYGLAKERFSENTDGFKIYHSENYEVLINGNINAVIFINK